MLVFTHSLHLCQFEVIPLWQSPESTLGIKGGNRFWSPIMYLRSFMIMSLFFRYETIHILFISLTQNKFFGIRSQFKVHHYLYAKNLYIWDRMDQIPFHNHNLVWICSFIMHYIFLSSITHRMSPSFHTLLNQCTVN